MSDDKTQGAPGRVELLGANTSFYESLETFDLGRMRSIWFEGAGVRCVHPGWEAIDGYDAIIESWDQVFRNTGWIRVTPTNVVTHRMGDLGLVYCAENITANHEGDVGVAVTMATNLFRHTPDGWKMLLHHASPAPVEVTQPFGGTFQ